MDTAIVKNIEQMFYKQKRKIEKAERVAMRRAVNTAKAKAIDNIRKDYRIKRIDLNNEIKMRYEMKKMSLRVYHRALGLIKFGARQTKKGVTFAVKTGKREIIPSAFITQVGIGKHLGVFKRKGKKRLPISEKYGPSVKQLFSTKETEKILAKIFRERYGIELRRAIKYAK